LKFLAGIPKPTVTDATCPTAPHWGHGGCTGVGPFGSVMGVEAGSLEQVVSTIQGALAGNSRRPGGLIGGTPFHRPPVRATGALKSDFRGNVPTNGDRNDLAKGTAQGAKRGFTRSRWLGHRRDAESRPASSAIQTDGIRTDEDLMAEEPFYSPFRQPEPPRQPVPGEVLWQLRKGHGVIRCELRNHGQ